MVLVTREAVQHPRRHACCRIHLHCGGSRQVRLLAIPPPAHRPDKRAKGSYPARDATCSFHGSWMEQVGGSASRSSIGMTTSMSDTGATAPGTRPTCPCGPTIKLPSSSWTTVRKYRLLRHGRLRHPRQAQGLRVQSAASCHRSQSGGLCRPLLRNSRGFRESVMLPWAGGLAFLALPTTDPAEDLRFLKPKGGDIFRRVRKDGSEAEEFKFVQMPSAKSPASCTSATRLLWNCPWPRRRSASNNRRPIASLPGEGRPGPFLLGGEGASYMSQKVVSSF